MTYWYLPGQQIILRVFWLAAFFFAATVTFAQSAEETQPSTESIAGLWGAVKIYPPSGSFRVTLQRDGDELIASARGETLRLPVPPTNQLNFEFPHGTGAFRGERQSRGRRYVGHWITPPSTMTYSHFAAPLTLHQLAANQWSGTAIPPEQSFSIYISIQEEANGQLTAFLRNPERNQGVQTRLQSVHQEGNRVRFLDSQGTNTLSGQFDDERQTLSVVLPRRGGTYDLKRLSRADATGFVPRRKQEVYGYESPIDRQDGWAVNDADNSGLSSRSLEGLVQEIINTTPTSIRTPSIHSVLIAHRGKLVLEEYFHGYYAERLHDLRSATKSVTGIMAGVALNEIDTLNLGSSVYAELGVELPAPESHKASLTVEHLLNMNSGYHCDDNDYETPGNEDRMQSQNEHPDWWSYTLNLPMKRAPGEKAVYCSAGINLLGGVISKATGEWLPEFFRSRLAAPLQIDHYQMNLDPQGRGYAGGGIQMRPRDFLKFGQLMLQDGKWRGKQLIPKKWARQSLQARVSINSEDDYGYTWWVNHLPYKDRTVEAFSATGNGGQMLILIPELDLLVGFTGGNYGDYRTWSAWQNELVPRYVLAPLDQ